MRGEKTKGRKEATNEQTKKPENHVGIKKGEGVTFVHSVAQNELEGRKENLHEGRAKKEDTVQTNAPPWKQSWLK